MVSRLLIVSPPLYGVATLRRSHRSARPTPRGGGGCCGACGGGLLLRALETPGLQEAQLLQDDQLRIAEFGDAERPSARTSVNGFPNGMSEPPGAALGVGDRHELVDGPLGVLGLVHGKPLLFGVLAALRHPYGCPPRATWRRRRCGAWGRGLTPGLVRQLD